MINIPRAPEGAIEAHASITYAEAVESCGPLVRHLAARFLYREHHRRAGGGPLAFEDLCQEGYLALFRASELWRP